MWCLVRVEDNWWVESGLGHASFGIVGPLCSRFAAVPTSAIGGVSIVLRDVGPSLVGGLVLPHGGAILQTHIRHVREKATV